MWLAKDGDGSIWLFNNEPSKIEGKKITWVDYAGQTGMGLVGKPVHLAQALGISVNKPIEVKMKFERVCECRK